MVVYMCVNFSSQVYQIKIIRKCYHGYANVMNIIMIMYKYKTCVTNKIIS